MKGLLDRLRRRPAPEAGPSPAVLSRKLDEQAALLKTLVGTVHKQAQQIKRVQDTLEEQERRWQATVERVVDKHTHDLRDLAEVQRKTDVHWQEVFDNDAIRHKREMKWRVSFARQISAVVRRLCLPADLPHPFWLASRRFQLRSQFEEDGIILALIERIGPGTRRFVEIGCGRSGGNSAALAFDCGWTGIMIDASERSIEGVRRNFAINPGVESLCATVLPETVNELLAAHGYAGEVDVLSLDIDSYDYWVLDALTVCQPRILIVEYNASFGSSRAVTIPYPQPLDGTPKGYHGASLPALVLAARRKGYRLVLCEHSGVNAFFLRHDLAPEIPELPIERAFRPALSRVDFEDENKVEDVYRLAAERGLRLIDV
jgi:hypothetical protein